MTQTLSIFVGVLWTAMRLPALALLVIAEPLVRFLLGALSLLLLVTALFLQAVSVRPVPSLGMVLAAVGAFAALVLYEKLIRVLS